MEKVHSLQDDEILLQQETGHIAASFFLEFSQKSPKFDANSPQQTKRLSAFLNSPEKGIFLIVMRGDVQLAKAALFIGSKNTNDAYLGCCEVREGPEAERLMFVLLTTAVGIAKARGAKIVYGPLDKSTWYNYRIRTDGHELSFPWEPGPQPFLADCWRRFGFQTAVRFESLAYSKSSLINMRMVSWLFVPALLRARRQGYQVVPFHADWKQNLEQVYRIAQDSFDGSFLYEPISFSDFVDLYAPMGQSLDFRPSFFLVNPAGEAVGFVLAFYDREYLVIKSLGLVSSLQGKGLGRCLAHATLKAGADDGYTAGIAALVRRGNRTALMAELVKKLRVLSWIHDYELLAYQIPDR